MIAKSIPRGWPMLRLAIVMVWGAISTSAAYPQTAAPVPQRAGDSGNTQVVMKAIRFQPAELTVRAGETVEWKNEDIVAHTVTANDGSFDSGPIAPGASWKMTMKNAGEVDYHCRPHPNMIARIKLTGAAQRDESHSGFRMPAFTPPHSPQEFHPILVNFTAALLPLALLSDLLGLWARRPSLHAAASWMVLYEAIISPLTAIAGLWWKNQSGGALPHHLIALHQGLGASLVVMFAVLAVWGWRIFRRDGLPTISYLVVAGMIVLALICQGSLGGMMVFGR